MNAFSQTTFSNVFSWMKMCEFLLKISLTFVPKAPINNIPSLVQIMVWRRPGDKPLSEPMMVGLLTHICVTRPQWVKESPITKFTMGILTHERTVFALQRGPLSTDISSEDNNKCWILSIRMNFKDILLGIAYHLCGQDNNQWLRRVQFTDKGPVMKILDLYFAVSLNKQSRYWWN